MQTNTDIQSFKRSIYFGALYPHANKPVCCEKLGYVENDR